MHNIGRSFELIFMKFTPLGWTHPSINPTVFGKDWFYRTTDMGENMLPNLFFGFNLATMAFFEEKTYKLELNFSQTKCIFIFVI